MRVLELSAVNLNHGAVVAAGAVVTRSFPAYSVVAGVPAKLIERKVQDLYREAVS